jgi:hypothetical protein
LKYEVFRAVYMKINLSGVESVHYGRWGSELRRNKQIPYQSKTPRQKFPPEIFFLLNAQNFSYVRQRKILIHAAQPLVLDPSPFEVQIAVAKVERYKPPGSDQMPAELIKIRGKNYSLRSINTFILLGIRKKCVGGGRRQLLH